MKTIAIRFLIILFLSSCALEQLTVRPDYCPSRLVTDGGKLAYYTGYYEAAIRLGRITSKASLMTELYKNARSLFLKGDDDSAILHLEDVACQDPRVEGSLTLLARALYRQGHYDYSRQILLRALALNRNDEIAWLVYGLTQLRLGDDKKGIESLKGGLTVLSKVSTSGYRGFPNWDSRNLVREAMRRTAFLIVNLDKVSAGKENVINSSELMLRRVDEEELAQRGETSEKNAAKDPVR
jgi:tetratricopeptide (TPR) repeat protein